MDLIYVTGMHRSGTSAATRVLSLLGTYLGPEQAMLPTAADNVRGFWEPRDVTSFNNRLLAHFGGRWDRPPVLSPGSLDSDELRPWYEEAEQIVGDLQAEMPADGPQVFAMKDPRFSLLLPFWLKVLPASHVVMSLRSPEAVTKSLMARNEMAPDRATGLWLRYVAETLSHAPQTRLVHYDDLLDRPHAEARALAADLGLPDPGPEALAQIDEFLSSDLDHSTSGPEVPDSPLQRLATSVFDRLRTGDPSGPELAAGVLTFGLDQAENDGERESLHATVETLQAALARAEKRAGVREEQLERRKQRESRLRQRIERLEGRRDDLRAEARDLRGRLRRRTRTLQEVRQERDRIRAELTALEQRKVVRAAVRLMEPFGPVVRRAKTLRTRD